MQGMWVQSLGQEDPLEEEMATQSSILAWRIPWAGTWQAAAHEIAELDSTEYTCTRLSSKNSTKDGFRA